MSSKKTARNQVISGLRQLADYLDQNPNVPVNDYGWDLCKFASHEEDADGKSQVDSVAAMLGVEVADDTANGGHYRAVKSFGPIRYEMICVTQQCRAAHKALMSYDGAVMPDVGRTAA